ncbi:class I SAM-dependent methyltransferase [Chromatium okenii]|jgi:SAM-dependent methyltransferase|uniref:Class I SAM-dependent methyltransferase n=1 Tax=Chromatium okenii TaxID=61644 RepID=A0A2S7XPJ3_9GAMM|nr:class I SAM-dependent methyltransferase [Chromatium okenii]MBV5309433.1 class I SAM-dependent methyltransferase [Chromatium okenii]PQJ95645.1 class I SAM-dependent methyltransferase [Chromatium okenii]
MPRVNNEAFYRSALDQYGETAEGVHWNSAETQELRFEIMRQLLPTDLSRLTLVDAGCGFGDLYCYLKQRSELPQRYIGLDVMEPMAATARIRTGCEILICDVLHDSIPEADYYICSGAMNTFTRDETVQFIKNCFAASRCGFIFNLLKGKNTSFTYNFYLPQDIIRIAQTLDAKCHIQEDYMIDDFTAIFTKNLNKE